MSDVLKLTAVFIAILSLLRLKWNIGYVLLAASGLLAIFYNMPFSALVSTLHATVTDTVTVKLFFSLTLIRVLETILRENRIMARMTEASRKLLKSKKAVIVSMPMLIGMLPSLGGAYFSAPMVEEASKGLKMKPEEKGFINYWFRHPWEYVLPLYPGILLASALTGISLRSFMLANTAYAMLVIVTGFLFSMRGVNGQFEVRSGGPEAGADLKGKKDLSSFLPLAIVLSLVMALNIELHYALLAVIVPLWALYRTSPARIVRTLRHGFALEVIILIFGAMLFKFMMDSSGAVVRLSHHFGESGVPALPVLIILPFISGLLTGLTVGFVGSTFPLLISIAGGAHLNEMTLAFAAGFLGVLLSPVHLCLVLTREYFKADAWGIYRRIVPASLIIMAAAFAEYFIL
jgi:hypothetical protein